MSQLIWRRVMMAAIAGILVVAVAAALGSRSDERAPARIASAAARPEWGIYQIYWRKGYAEVLARAIEPLASAPNYVMFYRDLGHFAYPRGPIETVRGVGAVPIISLELWTWHAQGRHLPRLNKGDCDGALRAWAEAARADGGRVLLRFGFEMNGNWFSWSGDPEAYKRAWRRAHAIFVEVGATNVEWVWSPNVMSVPDTPANAMHRYYPGDDVVDWVALDGYNFGEHHDKWHHWESFDDVFREGLEGFAARYPEKPVLIGETGCAAGAPGRKARWVREAWETLKGFPHVRAVIWFNFDKRREKEQDWRIASSPGALAAFNETFARR